MNEVKLLIEHQEEYENIVFGNSVLSYSFHSHLINTAAQYIEPQQIIFYKMRRIININKYTALILIIYQSLRSLLKF